MQPDVPGCRICKSLLHPEARSCHMCGWSPDVPLSDLQGRAFHLRAALCFAKVAIVTGVASLFLTVIAWSSQTVFEEQEILAIGVCWAPLAFPILGVMMVDSGQRARAPRVVALGVFYSCGWIPLAGAVYALPPPSPSSLTAIWCFALYVGGAASLMVLPSHYVFRRPLAGQNPLECRKCGYYLHGLAGPRCPECGQTRGAAADGKIAST